MALPTLMPGTLFGSRWIVGRVLGKSELGIVYEAEQARAGIFAALKLLEPDLARDRAAWSRFETLTQALAQIPGEGTARSYEVGIHDGQPYVASERIRFPTLARYVLERGALSPRAVEQALRTLGSALDASHQAGITHGNLKPQNLFVSLENAAWARITDYGLSELRAAHGIDPPRTLGFSAPELETEPPTPAGDRYALALLGFFALSGGPWFSAQRPGPGGPVSTERSSLASERARSLGAELDPTFDAWFTRALAHDPAERFESGDEMVRAFAHVIASGGNRFGPTVPPVGAHDDTAPSPQVADLRFPAASPTPAPKSAPPAAVSTRREAPPRFELAIGLGLLGAALVLAGLAWLSLR